MEAIINVTESEEGSTLLLLILSREFRETIYSTVNLLQLNSQNGGETSDQKTKLSRRIEPKMLRFLSKVFRKLYC